jgi:DNA-binding response OmpR family regulator
MNRNLTILIAEDDEDYGAIVQAAIKSSGWLNPIRILPNGEQVIKYLGGEGEYADRTANPFPSVMFLDVKMPGVNGFDVLRWTRDHPECSVQPTLMLSSSDDPKDIKLAYELGAHGFFLKPAKLSDLKSMLQAIYGFCTWSLKPMVGSGAG